MKKIFNTIRNSVFLSGNYNESLTKLDKIILNILYMFTIIVVVNIIIGIIKIIILK